MLFVGAAFLAVKYNNKKIKERKEAEAKAAGLDGKAEPVAEAEKVATKQGVEEMAKVKAGKLERPEPVHDPYMEKIKKAEMERELLENPADPDQFKNTQDMAEAFTCPIT